MEALYRDLIRPCELSDRAAFRELWAEYLAEREAAGALVLASNEALDLYTEMWREVVVGGVGVSLIVPGMAVNLWAAPCRLPVRGGPLIDGQGTYVRPNFRRSGVGGAMYQRGFDLLRQQGFKLFSGSVDAGNDLGERNAENLKSRVIQVTRVVEL